MLQGEVDESEAALSFGVPSIEGVSLTLLAKGDEVERVVRLEEATALLEALAVAASRVRPGRARRFAAARGSQR